ncbi:MAG: hypothetical protein J5699_09035 [Bacteroidales bacterium]|nr:hypothetical protein [Bacteroidales bacterium]
MDLSSLSRTELEALLEEYPWFSLARREYARRLKEPAAAKQRVMVVGGDYFEKQEYDAMEAAGQTFDTSTLASSAVAGNPVREEDFCTETLARIYLEQEFYQRAIEIYEKLILQYPQKSAYFAALIDKAKNIKQ